MYFACFQSFSQGNSNIIKYTSNSMHLRIENKDGKEISTIPMSNKVTIEYDNFYKSYSLFLIMQEGYSIMKLTFLKNESNGSIRMIDEKGEIYYIIDTLSKDGRLRMLRTKTLSGEISWMIISGAKIE